MNIDTYNNIILCHVLYSPCTLYTIFVLVKIDIGIRNYLFNAISKN